jgi:hypothetical protein
MTKENAMTLGELVLYLLGVGAIGLGVGVIAQFWRDTHSNPPSASPK